MIRTFIIELYTASLINSQNMFNDPIASSDSPLKISRKNISANVSNFCGIFLFALSWKHLKILM